MNLNYIYLRKTICSSHTMDFSNKEWLYMLGEETKHSVAIEGIFSDEKVLKNIIENNTEHDVKEETLNYFKTAQFTYDFALNFRKTTSVPPYIPLIKTLHSELFKNINSHFETGSFRRNPIHITNARITPSFNPEDWIDFFQEYIPYALEKFNICESIARIHTLFEAIHPFNDGNGRVGRILMNFILITNGYCNIAIKGLEQSDRNIYYHALESADIGIEKLFNLTPDRPFEKKVELIAEGNFFPMEEIIFSALITAMNRCIIISTNKEEHLTVKEAAQKLDISESAVKQRINKGTLIGSKNKKGIWQIYNYNLD